MKVRNISVSVRELVEFVMRSGDLVSSFSGASRAVEGTKAHQILQKSRGKDYSPEVTVALEVQREDIILEVKGRIDGVFRNDKGIFIEEIKSTTLELELIDEDYNKLHFAQAKCYAYIYANENSLEEINVQLTYYNLDSGESKYIIKSHSFQELSIMFNALIDEYLRWARIIMDWSEIRDNSIKEMEFPFVDYRKGQRQLAVSVYRAIRDGKILYAQAPTGTGKTAAVLFPSIKALGEGIITKIFYLTAKTVTRTVAENSVNCMRGKGLRLKTLNLTAKEKICLKPGAECNPEECEFAKGHFDRVTAALKDIFIFDNFTAELIEEYASKHQVCPFEFSLDLSLWSDCIICDYNYVFDPRVYLKRFFIDGGGDFAFLIDEAHNLVDRGREMFSAELFKNETLELKSKFRGVSTKIYKYLNKLNSFFLELKKEGEAEDCFQLTEAPKEIIPILRALNNASEEWLLKNQKSPLKKELLELYFNAAAFLRTYEYYDERYMTYREKLDKNNVKLKLFCMDPSHLIEEVLKRGKASVFFSATLSPMDYFISLLGGSSDSIRLTMASPFPKENLCVLVNNRINTTYKRREHTYDAVVSSIHSAITGKKGNYLVFLPSYIYMKEISDRYIQLENNNKVIVQKAGMNEEEKKEFIMCFSEENREGLVGFAVMGGSFGEGIDLVGEMLSGAIIVGVGLPQLSFERNLIMNYYNNLNSLGFEYSYIYPGMNRVLQAVGRVIRSETDKGIALLIDERFFHQGYRKLFPIEWEPVKKIFPEESTEAIVKSFWDSI